MICSTALDASSTRMPLLEHRTRQPRLDTLDPVLHFDRRTAGVGAGHEIGGDVDLAQRVAGGLEIEDAGGPIRSSSISRVTLL